MQGSILGLPCGSTGKESAHNAGDVGLDPRVGKITWRRERLPTTFSGLENSMNYLVHGVTKSCTQLSDLHFHCNIGTGI